MKLCPDCNTIHGNSSLYLVEYDCFCLPATMFHPALYNFFVKSGQVFNVF